MLSLRKPIVFLLLLLTNTAFGQSSANPITSAEIEEQVIQQLDAFANADYQLIAAKEYAQGPGFGFRARTAGSDSENLTIAMLENAMKAFFDTLEYYNINVEEIQTAVHGDTGIAWGVHIEDFQVKGREPETHRVRFSYTFRRNEAGELFAILAHRDIQEFDENGQYIP